MIRTTVPPTAGERDRQKAAERSRRRYAGAAEIGPLPAVADPVRRLACERDLRLFLVTYFPHSTGLKPFSAAHLRVVERIERCILDGGRFANAMPRGFGKTTLLENATLWATLYGHRRFIPIFSADKDAANRIIESIKAELESNDLLAADFPEACHPVRELEGKSQRCRSQTIDGELTRLQWTADTIVLPTIHVPAGWMPDVADGAMAPCSGAIIRSKGLLGASRGMKHKRHDGIQQRPDMVILDDPQTDVSAINPDQTTKRLNVIAKAVLKLGGHTTTLAAVLNGNIIAKGDLVERLLTRPEYAAWQGERLPMVLKWSDAHETLWLDQYAKLRKTYDKDDPQGQAKAHAAATRFYQEHRAEMDAGMLVAWEYCYDEETEVSAIQHAYNALIDDGEEVFSSECQNDPQEKREGEEMLTADQIAAKVNGRKRGTCPASCEKVTAMVDVHDALLYWTATGWSAGFTGNVLDYGTWPQQDVSSFSMREAHNTLQRKYDCPKEAAILAGLVELIESLFSRVWARDDGLELRLDLLLVDGRYLPDTIAQAVRRVNRGQAVMPSFGIPISAKQAAMSQWTPKPGERRGHYWTQGPAPSMPGLQTIKFDANHWKTHLHARYATALGSQGALSLFGMDPAQHRLVSEHLASEYPTTTEGRGRRLQEWQLRPGGPDNHFLDTGVGCCVAASVLGITLAGAEPVSRRPKQRVKLSELQRQKWAGLK